MVTAAMLRGEVYQLRASRTAAGHEQAGRRYAVVVQSDDLLLSTVVVVPTSTKVFQTLLHVPLEGLGTDGRTTFALCEQVTAVDPERRLGAFAGVTTFAELQAVDEGLRLVQDL